MASKSGISYVFFNFQNDFLHQYVFDSKLRPEIILRHTVVPIWRAPGTSRIITELFEDSLQNDLKDHLEVWVTSNFVWTNF